MKYALLVLLAGCSGCFQSVAPANACTCDDKLISIELATELCPTGAPVAKCDAAMWTLSCVDGKETKLRIVGAQCDTLER